MGVVATTLLPYDSGHGAAGGSIEFLGHAAGQVRVAAGEDSVLHCGGHGDGIFGFGDGRVHKDSVVAEFEGDGGI